MDESSLEYEWKDMISEELDFVGKPCFLAIEYIFTDKTRFSPPDCPNIHTRFLPLDKR